MFGISSRSLRSGKPENPTPQVLIQNMLTDLIKSKRWSWVTFETKSMKYFAEVAHENDELILNLAYPFSEDYQTLFLKNNLPIPPEWRLTKFQKKSWFGAGFLEFTTTVEDQERVVDFIDRLYSSLYNSGTNYELTGHFQ